MLSANFHRISYRLRTELAVEAWHWNPRGRWSDPSHSRGYWTSDDQLGAPITTSYGYRLPRRGSTIDQANEDGYSRIDDGDSRTFWKSNPYLDQRYTDESNERHPQWVVVDLEHVRGIDAARIHWGAPFATRYEVQYWSSQSGNSQNQPDDADDDPDGGWKPFPHGVIARGAAAIRGDVTLHLSDSLVHTRWVRLLLRESSNRAAPGSTDLRDALGYAVRELSIGALDSSGKLHDYIRHAANATDQTRIYVSSTDPWHRGTDRDPGVEQPGIDLLFHSGITRGLQALLPVGVLYDTPDNAAALLRYVRRRGYPVPRMELGEEPDGQYVSPDDFASLYMQTAHALHDVDSNVQLGGPSFQSAEVGVMATWKHGNTDTPWLTHFLNDLRAHGRSRDFSFLSFEWYPFDSVCGPTAPQLATTAARLRDALQQFTNEGLPPGLPMIISEYGYSAFAGEPEVTRAGAILNALSVAEFLTQRAGGAETYLYGTEPSSLDRNAECDGWGDNTLFLGDGARHIRAPTATYRGARLLTTSWADSAGGPHALLKTMVTSVDRSPTPIDAFTVRRPDGRISVLLLNRDAEHTWSVDVRLRSPGAVRVKRVVWQLSESNYAWHPNGPHGYAAPNREPQAVALKDATVLQLPAYSITVSRE